jgi:glycosyltransferase involved in cell wall biosynthesis
MDINRPLAKISLTPPQPSPYQGERAIFSPDQGEIQRSNSNFCQRSNEKDASLEVIIPVKDRVEVIQCVHSLTSINQVKRVIICDGGSTQTQCVEALHQLQQQPNVEVVHFPEPGFNKSRLLNQGIVQTTSELLLISDADILWNEAALQAVSSRVLSDTDMICCIQDVEESEPNSMALQRDRYTYHCAVKSDVALVEVVPWSDNKGQRRPGCGLICAKKTTLITLGGYKEIFKGWGWEDQDLLIRAHLFGFEVGATGKVMHLSHSDKVRNQHCGNTQPIHTRNRNITVCLESLVEGSLVGDLLAETRLEPKLKKIQVRLPECFN